jgi:signal transduction histidine kinase
MHMPAFRALVRHPRKPTPAWGARGAESGVKPTRCLAEKRNGMQWLPDARDETERAYMAELRDGRMGAQVRVASIVIGIINTAFMALDAFAYPEHFAHFVWVRLALNAALLLSHQRFSRTNPVAGQALVALSTCAMLLTVIYATNAPTSDYYVGLVLFLVGLPVLLPLRPIEGAAFLLPPTAAFMVSPLILGGLGDVEGVHPESVWLTFTIHCCFLAGASLAGVASSYILDRIRFNEFAQRRSLEQARDELRELDRAKSRFSANIHHELRTPLTLILSPLEALLGGQFGAVESGHREYLESMRDNAQRLMRLISNLLDLSKIESSALTLHRRSLQIGPVVDGLVASAQPLARTKGVVLEKRGFDSLPEVRADLDAVEKILLNLIGNALKFTSSGGRVDVVGLAEPGNVVLVVEDNGAGIPAAELDNVFDRFAQVDGSATRAHEGTGIGLSLAKELVELHGGSIWAESGGEGLGSRFCVVLPLGSDVEMDEEDDSSAAYETHEGERALQTWKGSMGAEVASAMGALGVAAEADPVEPEPADDEARLHRDVLNSRPRLLVVEDNRDMRRFLAAILGTHYSVVTAANGREGLDAALAQRPDLVVTDVMMPEMSGTDLCRALEDDPKTRGTPVLLLTARADREMKIEGLELGARDYVTKPFHPQELLARVRSIVQIEQLQRKLAHRNRVLESTIYELKQTEVQLVQAERLAAVGELAAGVAHEVNNPVNFAINSLQALRARVADVGRLLGAVAEIEPDRPEQVAAGLQKLERMQLELDFAELQPELEELVAIAAEGLDRTHRLVGDLQNFAGHGSAERGPVDVRAGLASTVRLVQRAVKDAGAEIECDFAADVPVIESSASVLNQVFLNLLKNAAEAMDGRSGSRVQLSARSEVDARSGPWVVVEVSDDGPGIDEVVRGQLFEPFVSTKPAGRGAGLGLSVCRRILADLGGTIDLVDREGPGATFQVRLPADPPPERVG